MTELHCPTPEGIVDCLLGRVAPERLESWQDHADRCPRCRELAGRYESVRDSLLCDLAVLRPPKADPVATQWLESAMDQLEPELRALPESFQRFHTWMRSEGGGISTDLLQPPTEPSSVRAPPGYECGRLLGAGGFGEAYRAFHIDSGRMVALKIPAPRRIKDERVLARFEREIRVLQRLDHPSVVKYLDAGHFDDGLPYVILELLRGEALSEAVRRLGPFAVPTACGIVVDLFAALEHATNLGIVHRDVAPKNVFWESDGSVRLMDWGLSKLAHEVPEGYPWDLSTGSGEFWGTPDYAAPEQWRNFHQCDTRTDIYAAGWTLVYLLTGEAPGRALPSESATIGVGREGLPLLARRPDLPQGLVTALRRMLQAAPERRPQTPGEAAALLAPFAVTNPAEFHARPKATVDQQPQASVLEDTRASAAVAAEAIEFLSKSDDPMIAELCRCAEEARGISSAPKSIRLSFLGVAGSGKTELMRALVPELPELTWQSSTARLVALRYAENSEAQLRIAAEQVDGPVPLKELASAIQARGDRPSAVEIGIPSDFLARGFELRELRPSSSPDSPFGVADSILAHTDVVVWCVPPDLDVGPVGRVQQQLRRWGHEAALIALTRMDSVRREVERARLVDFGRRRLTKETALGLDGLVFVSAAEESVSLGADEEVGTIDVLHRRLLRYFGPWSIWIRDRRPLLLLQHAVDIASQDGSGQSSELRRLAAAIRTEIDVLDRCREIRGGA